MNQENLFRVAAVTFSTLALIALTIDSAPASHNPSDDAAGSTHKQEPTKQEVEDPYPHFEDGTFIVGKDVQPGTYRTRTTPSSSCYYARLNSFNTSDIVANENTVNPAVITINPNDKAFISDGCGKWTQDLSAITTGKDSFSDDIVHS